MYSVSKTCVTYHHIELAKYVNWPLLVSIIGPEQRGPAAMCNLLSIWSENPVPNHFGEEKASIFRLAGALGSGMCLAGTLIGALMRRDSGEAATC